MASEAFVQAAIPRFDGHYDQWSMLMHGELLVVESGLTVFAGGQKLTKAQKTGSERLKLKDLKAKNYFFQAIDRSILETILCKDTSKQI